MQSTTVSHAKVVAGTVNAVSTTYSTTHLARIANHREACAPKHPGMSVADHAH